MEGITAIHQLRSSKRLQKELGLFSGSKHFIFTIGNWILEFLSMQNLKKKCYGNKSS